MDHEPYAIRGEAKRQHDTRTPTLVKKAELGYDDVVLEVDLFQ
jgi:hypothetical protein